MKLLTTLCAAVGLAHATSLVDNGHVVTLGGVKYYVGGVPVGKLDDGCRQKAVVSKAKMAGSDLFPMTIMETSERDVSVDDILDIAAEYDDADDVYQPEFLRSIYLRSTGSRHPAKIEASVVDKVLRRTGGRLLMAEGGLVGKSHNFASGSLRTAVRGPVFVSAVTGTVYKAHRLYTDHNLAFIQGTVDDENGGYYSLPATTEDVMAKSIAVPSRLYYRETEDKPLAGLRLGVKDIYHVKGVGTSGGNRAYFYLYGVQNETSPSIQRLIDLGAAVVGKMGTVQFANGDRPTADWVDLHCPFNPRGDGYQQPSGSSTGSAAGLASYDWLDISVGSDTGGSMRGPASSQGLFGNRPSTGAVTMDHVIPLSPVADTAGVFARSGELWAKVTQSWYPDMASNFTSYPGKLYRSANSRGYDGATPEAKAVIDGFYDRLAKFLGTKAVTANFTRDWAETHTEGPDNVGEMLYLTYAAFVSHDQWRLLGRPFFDDYAAAHDGRQPYVNPGPLARWNWGIRNAPDDVYQQALDNITTFTEWYTTRGYGRPDDQSCSEAVYSLIYNVGSPSYRDEYFGAPSSPPLGFSETRISVIGGHPEVVVPIGEAPYESSKTMHTEYLPVTVSLSMAKGCDYHLASLVRDLEKEGILNPVSVGTRLYP